MDYSLPKGIKESLAKNNDDSQSSEYTEDDLMDAQIKRFNGQKISREEEIMLDGYDKWKADQDRYKN